VTSASSVSAGDNGRPQLGILLLLALPVITLLAIGSGIAFGVRGAEFNVLALAVLMGAVALVPVILDVRRRFDRRHILLSFMSLAFFGLFVLSVFTNYFFASDELKMELSNTDLASIRPHDLVRGQLAALVGWLCLLVGYLVPIGRLFPGGIPTPRRNWTFRASLMVALLMIPLGWAIFLASQFGILPRRAGSGFLGMISNSTFMGIALLMLIYLRFGARELLYLMLVLIPPSMAFNFLGGSKTALLTPPAVVAVAYIVVRRRIAIRWVVAAVALVVFIYPIAEFQRRVILRENTKGAVYALKRPVETISRISRFAGSYEFGDYLMKGVRATTRRSDGLGILSVILRDCPSRVPFQGGWTLGYIPLSYVPRLVWADKPDMTTGQWVTDNFGGGPAIRSATAPTWIGELYYNFGWPAIVIGMLIMGVFMRTLHECVFPPKATVPAQMMAILVLFFFPQTLQGSLMSPVNAVVFGAIPIVVGHWGVRLLGGAPMNESGREQVRGFATDAPAGI
jgi:hypothetical protein